MANSNLKPWYKKWWAIALFIIIGITIIGALSDDKPTNKVDESNSNVNQVVNQTETMPQLDFNAESRKRFDEVKENFPELKNIECLDGDCTSVVYFNFNTVPDDLEFAIRSNTATFSKFKLDNTGTSHVTIFATHNNKTIFQCNGAKGVVKECK